MSKSNSLENGLLELIFKNTNFANVGDATGLRGSSTAGSLYASLHTADPGEAGPNDDPESFKLKMEKQGYLVILRSDANPGTGKNIPRNLVEA